MYIFINIEFYAHINITLLNIYFISNIILKFDLAFLIFIITILLLL